MANNEKVTVVYVYETPLEVAYVIRGKYIPATMLDPEEYPELEILNVRVQDLDIEILEFLSDYQIEHIRNSITEKLD
jgi:hypothetical protein